MKTAVIVAGVLRHCDVSSLSWDFSLLDVDFYLSTWDLTEYVYNGNNFYDISSELEKLERINFKDIRIENYESFFQLYKNHPGFEMSRFFYLVNKAYEMIKDLKYDNVILIRPDLYLMIDQPNLIKDLESMKKNSAICSRVNKLKCIDFSKTYTKQQAEEILKREKEANDNVIHMSDDHFIFDWLAFEKFVKLWPTVIFKPSCPHETMFRFFFVDQQARLSITASIATNINRAPLEIYQQRRKLICMENIHFVSHEYEKQCKLTFPKKNKTIKEIEEYFKNKSQ